MSLHHGFSVSSDNQFADANSVTTKFLTRKNEEARRMDGRNAHVLVVLDAVASTSQESAGQMRIRVLFQFQQVNWNCLPQTPRAVCPRALLNPIPRAAPSLCRRSSPGHRYRDFSMKLTPARQSGRVHAVPDILRGINFYRPSDASR